MSGVVFDLRASVRQLRQRKLTALLAASTLGISLGVASALFAIVNALYVRPLPLDSERRVVVVRATNAEESIDDGTLSRLDMNDLLASGDVDAFGGFRDWRFALLANGTREPVEGALATPGFFDVFRAAPHLGRLLQADDDRRDRNRVAVLSFASWQRRFGSDPRIVGRTLTLGSDAFTVIGVLPERFTAPSFREVEIWAPLSFDSDYERGRKHRNLTVYARLARGASLDALRSDLVQRAQSLATEYPETNRGWSARALPLVDYELASVTRPLTVLTLAAALLLLMGCANLASLLFAETIARTSELGLRAAAGGSPLRLFRQLFFDHLLLCIPGARAAAALASLLLAAGAPFAAELLPRFDEVRADATLFAFTFGFAVLLAAILAAATVVWVTHTEPAEHLRASSRMLTGAASRRVNAWIATAQVAFAFILLALAVAYGRDYQRAASRDPGFAREGLVLLRVQALEQMRRTLLTRAAGDAADALRNIPGTRCATLATSGPLFGGREEIEITADGAAPPILARYTAVDATFFRCMEIPLISGRAFAITDDARSAPVAIVSRSLAARLFPRGEALGKTLRLGRKDIEIVGIAGDVIDERATTGGTIEIYLPFAQSPRASFFAIGRGTAPNAAATSIRRTLPSFLLVSNETMETLANRQLLTPRLQMLLLLVFALAASLLAAVAIYGMVALVTATRAGEIAIRLALGASPQRAALLLARTVAAPLLAALLAGAVAMRAYAGDATLPLTIAAAVVVGMTVVIAARGIIAVVREEPIEALRTL